MVKMNGPTSHNRNINEKEPQVKLSCCCEKALQRLAIYTGCR